MTWAGKQSEQPRSFQSPETYLLLTFPFIERACIHWCGQLPGVGPDLFDASGIRDADIVSGGLEFTGDYAADVPGSNYPYFHAVYLLNRDDIV